MGISVGSWLLGREHFSGLDSRRLPQHMAKSMDHMLTTLGSQ